LRDAAALIQKSIAHDLAKLNGLIAEKKLYEASLDHGTTESGGAGRRVPRLTAIDHQLSGPEMKTLLGEDKQRYDAYIKSLALQLPVQKSTERMALRWKGLVSRVRGGRCQGHLMAHEDAWSRSSWHPRTGTDPDFDDSTWTETTLPISWRDNHTAVLRATFDVAAPDAVKALRLNSVCLSSGCDSDLHQR
jgi:hypothetical protein